jgi:flavin-dependent dehydrogenase
MKVAIAGAGMTGAYLFRILKDKGYDVHLFDREQRTRCGLKPCAWGTSLGFVELVRHAGLDAEKYVIRRLDHVFMDGMRIKADLMIFDKPRLVKDLLRGADLRFTPVPTGVYDRIIDATGVARALLQPIDDDIVMGCRQYLIDTKESLENRIKLGGIGYAWCFPLSSDVYHIGCGSLLENPQHILKGLGWLESTAPLHQKKTLCNCTGKIRLTGAWHSQPFVSDRSGEEVWGIGEAIGCVAPLAGDGVVPGMRSVQLLMENWDKPRGYEKAVLREFRWMKDERTVIDKLRRSEGVGIREANILRKNSKRMGMQVGLREAVALLNNLG